MKICPRCNTKYDDKDNVCNHDGVRLQKLEEKADDKFDALIGTVLEGRFKIISKLGQGGMGAVYKAEQVRMNRMCAIKVIPEEMAKNADAIDRFDREAKMSALINDPHAVTVYDFGSTENGMYFLAMEYVEGETLSSLMRREGILPLSRVLPIVHQSGEALSAAHKQNMVHRDLKPDNIMISKKDGHDWVKILDFGIAKQTAEDHRNDLTGTGLVIGTPLYMSPEQLSGEKLDSRSDIYSYALIVYQMLTGCLPFQGENAQALMIKRLTDNPMPPTMANPNVQIPPGVEAAILAALARDRNMRTPIMAQFVEQLENGARGITTGPTYQINTGPQHSPPTGPYQMNSNPQYRPPSQQPMPPMSPQMQGNTPYPNSGPYANQGPYPNSGPYPNQGQYGAPTPNQPTPMRPMPQQQTPTPGRPQMPYGPPQNTPNTPANPMMQQPSHPTPSPFNPSQPTGPGVVPINSGSTDKITPVQPSRAGRGFIIALMIAVFLVLFSLFIIFFFVLATSNNSSSNLKKDDRPPITDTKTTDSQESKDNSTDTTTTDESAGNFTALERFEKGRDFVSANSYNNAIAEFRAALKLDPNYYDAQEGLAYALYRSDQLKEAIQEANNAVAKSDGTHGAAYTILGRALYDDQQYLEASKAFLQSFSIEQTDPEVFALAGFAAQLGGQQELANGIYDKYITLYSGQALAAKVQQAKAGTWTPPAKLPTDGQFN